MVWRSLITGQSIKLMHNSDRLDAVLHRVTMLQKSVLATWAHSFNRFQRVRTDPDCGCLPRRVCHRLNSSQCVIDVYPMARTTGKACLSQNSPSIACARHRLQSVRSILQITVISNNRGCTLLKITPLINM